MLRTGIPLLTIFFGLVWLAAQADHSHLIVGIVLALIVSYAIFVAALLAIERKRARHSDAIPFSRSDRMHAAVTRFDGHPPPTL